MLEGISPRGRARGQALRLPALAGTMEAIVDLADFHRRLVEGAPDGVLAVDRSGVIRFWNAGCERIFGYPGTEAIGKSLDIIIPDRLRARHWQGFAETIRTGVTRYGAGELLSVPALRKDRTRISVEFSIIPFRGEDGALAGIGTIMRDVTQRFEEMRALRAGAASSTRQKP
jgi:PAS domain S-box-containing protein